MKYYSQVTKHLYNSTEELVKAEREVELKRVVYDYNSKKNEYLSLMNKYEINKKLKTNNENEINKLKEWKSNLIKISQEMYGISEIIDVKKQMKLKETNEKNKRKLIKDLDIMDKSILSIKKKI